MRFYVLKRFAILASFLVAGCVPNAGYLMDTYGGHPHEVLELDDGNSFWVFDRPDLGKMATSPSPGTVIGPALIRGLSLMTVDLNPTIAVHQAVAMRWFEKTGRKCQIKTSFEIAKPEFEHGYVCEKTVVEVKK